MRLQNWGSFFYHNISLFNLINLLFHPFMYFVAFSDSLLFTVERIRIQYTQGVHKTGATILHTTEAAALQNQLLYHNVFTLIQNDNSTRKSFTFMLIISQQLPLMRYKRAITDGKLR